MKEQQNNGMKHLELTDADQIIEIECHVSKRLFELSAEDLISALCLFQSTKAEMEEDNI